MRKLILRNHQSPGDIVMLTAAVRDLAIFNAKWHMAKVRTPCPALWENSPHLTPLADGAAGAEEIACGYPLIHRSNTGPWHFIHAVPLVPKFYFGTGLSAKLCFFLYGMEPLCTAMKRSFGDGSVPKCNFGTRNFGTRNFGTRNFGTRKSNCLRS